MNNDPDNLDDRPDLSEFPTPPPANLQEVPPRALTPALSGLLAKVNSPEFLAALMEDKRPTSLKVVTLRNGVAMAEYVNKSTSETTRIFVRDAGAIPRDLPGEGLTRYWLKDVKRPGEGFLGAYCDGEMWPGVLREFYNPEAWEMELWKWSKGQRQSVEAGALVLRRIGTKTCRGCGQPKQHYEIHPDLGKCTECVAAAIKAAEAGIDAERMADEMRTAGRNDLCPCGSGAKFKKCCMGTGAAPAITKPREYPKQAEAAPRWNGEPCEAAKGTVEVGKVESPTWWCAGMEGTRRRCVRITYPASPRPDRHEPQTFFIDDEDGQGTRKVWQEGGGPGSSHKGLPVDKPETFEAV